MTTILGIPNCDTVKKAIKWLDANKINYTFHDFRKDGFTEQQATELFQALDWQQVVNKRSTTFRNLPEEVKSNLTESSAKNHIVEEPTLIKRPVLIHDGKYHVGFKADQYEQVFA